MFMEDLEDVINQFEGHLNSSLTNRIHKSPIEVVLLNNLI